MRLKLNKPLPDKMSDLILVALADLRTVEQDPTYCVQMDNWHSPTYKGKCNVCLAGAVMACGGIPRDVLTSPANFKMDDDSKFMALDSLRKGNVFDAMTYLHLMPCEDYERPIAPYYQDEPEPFYNGMTKLAADLKAAGL